MVFSYTFGNTLSGNLPFDDGRSFQGEILPSPSRESDEHETLDDPSASPSHVISPATVEKTSSTAEINLKKRSCSSSDTEPTTESAPKRNKRCDVSEGELQITQKLLEYLKVGATFNLLGSYFKREHKIEPAEVKRRWEDLRPEHYCDVEETQAKPFDAFIIEGLKDQFTTGLANFEVIARKYNDVIPGESSKIHPSKLRARWITLGRGYPDQTYFPDLLPEDSQRDQEIALMLKCGFSIKMLERKLGFHARNIKHHWYYQLASKYPDVKPLSEKPFEESILKGILVEESNEDIQKRFPFLSMSNITRHKRILKTAYLEIFADMRRLFPNKIVALKTGSLSLDDLFETYFQYQHQTEPETIALAALVSMGDGFKKG